MMWIIWIYGLYGKHTVGFPQLGCNFVWFRQLLECLMQIFWNEIYWKFTKMGLGAEELPLRGCLKIYNWSCRWIVNEKYNI